MEGQKIQGRRHDGVTGGWCGRCDAGALHPYVAADNRANAPQASASFTWYTGRAQTSLEVPLIKSLDNFQFVDEKDFGGMHAPVAVHAVMTCHVGSCGLGAMFSLGSNRKQM